MENKNYSFSRIFNGVVHQFSVNLQENDFPKQGLVNCLCGKEHSISSDGIVCIGSYMTTWDGEFFEEILIRKELSDQSILEKQLKNYSFVDTKKCCTFFFNPRHC